MVIKNDDILNIVVATDNNYLKYTATLIISLFKSNQTFEGIVVYVLANNLGYRDFNKLKQICNDYPNRSMEYCALNDIQARINITVPNRISIVSYSRLFISSILPDNVKRVIYLDVDSLVQNDLHDVWNTDIKDNLAAAVLDMVSVISKINIGLNINDEYFNAGFLLIPVDKWREKNMEIKFVDFIHQYNGDVYYNDQGVINGVLKNKIFRLPPQYNLMTTQYEMTVKQIIDLNKNYQFYTQEEINKAKRNPVFIHFTPGFARRPWNIGCNHPLVNIYLKFYQENPFGSELIKDQRSLRARIISRLYHFLPFSFFKLIILYYQSVKSLLYKLKEIIKYTGGKPFNI